MSRTLSRKDFLAATGLATGSSLLAACDLSTKPSKNGRNKQGSTTKGNEPPTLASQVKAGKLPPLKERLPDKPIVIKPLRKVGRYGGTWRTVVESLDTSWFHMTVTYGQNLLHWDPHWKKVIPHLAESFEVNGDSTEYDFTFRKGTKWSDGHPFTVDDLVFWRDAYYANKELIPAIDVKFGDGTKPVTIKKIDDYHAKFVFEKPHGLFLEDLAFWQPPLMAMPAHYLKQFHKNYNQNIDEEVKKAKVKNWTELFFQKIDQLNNTELPTLNPWVAKNPWSNGHYMVWERNPYYFAVDTEGNQLPYLDQVAFRFYVDNPEALLLSAAHGDVDMYQRAEITIPHNKPVLARSMQSGGYTLPDVKDPDHNEMGICFNLTHKDPVKRKIFQNKDFRIGMSYAIDRHQIINVVFQRQGTPAQTAPRPEAPFYDEVAHEMATQYTEYDPAKANAQLDKAGFSKRDSQGRRLGPDGKPIIITILTQTRYPFMNDALQLIQDTWNKVGIETHINNADSTLVGNKITANDFDVTVDHGELGYLDMIDQPRWLFASSGSSYAPLWSNYFLNLTPKEEPPAAMKQQMDIWWNEVFPTSSLQEQVAGMRKIVKISRDEFWTLGIILPVSRFAIVTNRFHNVPGDDQMWLAFSCPYPAAANVEQFYIQE